MRSLTHNAITISHVGDEFVISQMVGATADDIVTIKVTEDQALQIAKFLSPQKARVSADLEEPAGAGDGFEEFWREYPRKDGKARAFDLWKRHRLHAECEAVMRHLLQIKQSEQWTKDGGRFVPHAATYISQKRYLDEIEAEDLSAWT